MLYEHQDEVTRRKADGETALKLAQDDHRLDEVELKGDRRALKLELKESELAHDDFLKGLKAEHDRNITALRHEFERRGTETQKHYEKRTKEVRETLEDQRRRETLKIERAKNVHIEKLMASHEKAFAEIKNYYNDITHNNLDLIKSLKEEVGDMRRKELQDEKAMEHVAQENRRMSEPFKKAKEDVTALKSELEAYEEEKASLRAAKARLLVVESRFSALKWEDEVLRQRHAEVVTQRDALKKRFATVAGEVKQKAQFKALLLEKKLDAVAEQLEARDAQLDDALLRANVDVSKLSKDAAAQRTKARDVLERKAAELGDLRGELARVADAHGALVEAVAAKMSDLGVPTPELGFTPIQTSTLAGGEVSRARGFTRASRTHASTAGRSAGFQTQPLLAVTSRSNLSGSVVSPGAGQTASVSMPAVSVL